jgi:DNA (cytosine-5)-methyltransferase 1
VTTRNETGLALVPPFIAELRGGGSKHRPVSEPLCTVVANGNHHGLVTAYYGNGNTQPVTEALSTVTSLQRHALLMRNNTARGNQAQMTTPAGEPVRTITTTGHQSLLAAERPTIDLDDVLFRMLEPREIAAAMDFPGNYRILGNRREQVRQAGNAVTPPAARDLVGVIAESLGVAS